MQKDDRVDHDLTIIANSTVTKREPFQAENAGLPNPNKGRKKSDKVRFKRSIMTEQGVKFGDGLSDILPRSNSV